MSTNFSLTTASPQVNVIQSINYLLATQAMSSGNANVQLGNTIVQANTTTGQVYTNQQGTISYLYGYIDEKTFYGVKKNITFNQFLRNKNDKKLFAPGFHPSALGHELWTNELYEHIIKNNLINV